MNKILIYCLVLTGLLACSKQNVDFDLIKGIDYQDRVTKIEYLGTYSKFDAVQFLQLAKPSDQIKTRNGFSLYRFNYKTHDFEGQEVIVSGLVSIPETKNIKGLVSWQHGTNTYRPGSVSSPSADEGIGIMALFSGQGFLTVAPDYIGLGTSTAIHPYYHMESTANSVIDLVKIGEAILNQWPGEVNKKLYLAGFSQGGGASAATQRTLEKVNDIGLKLCGTALISGAYNLREISVPNSIVQNHFNGVIYLGYAVNAYAHIYQHPINSIIQEPYASHISSWFDGTKNSTFLKAHLPGTVLEFVQPSFVKAVEQGEANWFLEALHENETYNWQPIAPIRFYFGDHDIDVTPEDSKYAYQTMKNLGGNVDLFNLGPYDHDESIIKALPHVLAWFDENN